MGTPASGNALFTSAKRIWPGPSLRPVSPPATVAARVIKIKEAALPRFAPSLPEALVGAYSIDDRPEITIAHERTPQPIEIEAATEPKNPSEDYEGVLLDFPVAIIKQIHAAHQAHRLLLVVESSLQFGNYLSFILEAAGFAKENRVNKFLHTFITTREHQPRHLNEWTKTTEQIPSLDNLTLVLSPEVWLALSPEQKREVVMGILSYFEFTHYANANHAPRLIIRLTEIASETVDPKLRFLIYLLLDIAAFDRNKEEPTFCLPQEAVDSIIQTICDHEEFNAPIALPLLRLEPADPAVARLQRHYQRFRQTVFTKLTDIKILRALSVSEWAKLINQVNKLSLLTLGEPEESGVLKRDFGIELELVASSTDSKNAMVKAAEVLSPAAFFVVERVVPASAFEIFGANSKGIKQVLLAHGLIYERGDFVVVLAESEDYQNLSISVEDQELLTDIFYRTTSHSALLRLFPSYVEIKTNPGGAPLTPVTFGKIYRQLRQLEKALPFVLGSMHVHVRDGVCPSNKIVSLFGKQKTDSARTRTIHGTHEIRSINPPVLGLENDRVAHHVDILALESAALFCSAVGALPSIRENHKIELGDASDPETAWLKMMTCVMGENLSSLERAALIRVLSSSTPFNYDTCVELLAQQEPSLIPLLLTHFLRTRVLNDLFRLFIEAVLFHFANNPELLSLLIEQLPEDIIVPYITDMSFKLLSICADKKKAVAFVQKHFGLVKRFDRQILLSRMLSTDYQSAPFIKTHLSSLSNETGKLELLEKISLIEDFFPRQV